MFNQRDFGDIQRSFRKVQEKKNEACNWMDRLMFDTESDQAADYLANVWKQLQELNEELRPYPGNDNVLNLRLRIESAIRDIEKTIKLYQKVYKAIRNYRYEIRCN